MNNAVYGKTTKNLRNRIDVKLVSNKKDYLKWASKIHLEKQHQNNNNEHLNKPAYIGMCILELSEVLMHEFHYEYIK